MGGGDYNYKNFSSKLVKRLLLPYYLAQFLWYPFLVMKEHYFGHLLKIIFYSSPIEAFLGIFIGKPTMLPLGPLWFLPCLLIAEIIFIKIYNQFSKSSTEIFVMAVVISAYAGFVLSCFGYLLLGFNVALASQIFLLAGVLIRRYNFVEKMNLKIFSVVALLLIFSFQFNQRVEMSASIFGEPFWFYARGLTGTLIVMKLSALIKSGKIFSLINYCGRQSMLILVLHPLIIELLYNLLVRNNFATLAEVYHVPFFIFLSTALGVLIPLFIAKKFGKLPVIKYFCV